MSKYDYDENLTFPSTYRNESHVSDKMPKASFPKRDAAMGEDKFRILAQADEVWTHPSGLFSLDRVLTNERKRKRRYAPTPIRRIYV